MYRVDVVNQGGFHFQIHSQDYEFAVDTKEKGATPLGAFLAGLGSCIGVYVRKYAEGLKLNLGEFALKVEAELTQEAPICFKVINVYLDLKGSQLDERRKVALLEFIKNCPAHNTLKTGPEVNIKLV